MEAVKKIPPQKRYATIFFFGRIPNHEQRQTISLSRPLGRSRCGSLDILDNPATLANVFYVLNLRGDSERILKLAKAHLKNERVMMASLYTNIIRALPRVSKRQPKVEK